MYSKTLGKSVETKDFQNAIEKASGKDFRQFFDQWVYLKADWNYEFEEIIVNSDSHFVFCVVIFVLEI